MAAMTQSDERADRQVLAGTGRHPSAELPRWGAYSSFARRHAALFALCSLLGAGCGLATALSTPDSYSSTASVMLTPVPGYASINGETRPEQVTIDSDAQLVLSTRVISQVARALDADRGRVEDRASVRAVPLSQVLELSFTSTSRKSAHDGAEALADAFVDARDDSLLATSSGQAERVAARLRVIESRLVQRNRAAPTISSDEPLLEELVVLRARLHELEAARLQATEVINAPAEPGRPDARDLEVPMTSGLMAGTLLATCLGTLRDRWGASRRDRSSFAGLQGTHEDDRPAPSRQVRYNEAVDLGRPGGEA
jgi:hypothetical protein